MKHIILFCISFLLCTNSYAQVGFGIFHVPSKYYKESTKLLKTDSLKALDRIDFLQYRKSAIFCLQKGGKDIVQAEEDASYFIIAALDTDRDDIGLEYSSLVLKVNYSNIAAHLALAKFSKDPVEREFHRQVGERLFKSMTNSGDATSIERAMHVEKVYEEYIYIEETKGTFVKQALLKKDHKMFDEMTVQYESGIKTLYFDVTNLFPNVSDFEDGYISGYVPK